MNTIIGLLIIAVGSMGQSSSYVPINKIKEWSWENFWLTQGIFAWLVFPILGCTHYPVRPGANRNLQFPLRRRLASHRFWCIMGRRRAHLWAQHALPWHRAWTIGSAGNLCRVRHAYPCRPYRYQPLITGGSGSAAGRYGYAGGYRPGGLRGKLALQKHVGRGETQGHQGFRLEEGVTHRAAIGGDERLLQLGTKRRDTY